MRPDAPGWPGRVLRAGAPAGLVLLTAVHPAYSTDAAHEVDRIAAAALWLPLHLALLVAFAAYSVSMLTWPTARTMWWRVRQIGVLGALVSYSAFLGVDGIAGGVIARAAAHAPQTLRAGLAAAVADLFSQGVVGALALAGAAGWVVAAVAITVESAADARLLAPAALLVASAVLLGFSHDPPIGPFGAGLAVAAAVLLDVTLRRRWQAGARLSEGQSPQSSPTGAASGLR